MAQSLVINLPGLTDRGLAEAFIAGVASAESDLGWISLFPWDGASYSAQGFAPPSGYAAINDGDDVPTESVDETYAESITVSEAALGYATSMLTALTLRREVLVGLYKQLGALGVRFFSSEAYNILNNALVTLGGDGVALGSTSHPSAAGLQSNYLNSGFGFTSWEAAVDNLRSTKNHRGVIMGLRPTRVVLPTALSVLGHRVLTSGYRTNDISDPTNPQNQAVTSTVSPDLTSASRWFVFDDNATAFRMPVVRGPSPRVTPSDEANFGYKVRDRIALGTGAMGWRGVVVS